MFLLLSAQADPTICGLDDVKPSIELIDENILVDIIVNPPSLSEKIPVNTVCKIRIDSKRRNDGTKNHITIQSFSQPKYINSVHILAVDETKRLGDKKARLGDLIKSWNLQEFEKIIFTDADWIQN